MKVTRKSLLILSFLVTTFPAIGDDSEHQSSSFFSFLRSDAPLQASLDDHQESAPNVISFYEKMNHEPVWFVKGQLTNQGRVAIEVLKNADLEGLNPKDYEDAIHIADHPEQWHDNWVDCEILLTKRFLEFIDHVRIGRLDPMKVSADIKFHNNKTHSVEMLAAAVQDKDNQGNKLRLMAPNLPQYVELRRILAQYRKQAEETKEWPKLMNSNVLKMGDRDPEVVTLRQILVLQSDLAIKDDTGSDNFDAAVDKALRHFQKRYSLEPDGSVGTRTREALNYPINEQIQKVIVNMERLRWLPDELGHKHIIVNVAGYVLHGFEESEATIMMPIIVGRPDRRTPLFYTTLKNIVLNPSWGVPHSIYVHDKLPKIRHDRGYVKRSHFTVTDHQGRVIDPDAADWFKEGKNYYLRQRPGIHNALGQIKFNIENPYTVYLHGTPDQHLFAKKARALSSGCIRLKHPLKLAAWVLNNEPEWTCDSIQGVINTGQTQTIRPMEFVPVYFTYQTIWVKESKDRDHVYFSNDPYKLDAKMVKMMKLKA